MGEYDYQVTLRFHFDVALYFPSQKCSMIPALSMHDYAMFFPSHHIRRPRVKALLSFILRVAGPTNVCCTSRRSSGLHTV